MVAAAVAVVAVCLLAVALLGAGSSGNNAKTGAHAARSKGAPASPAPPPNALYVGTKGCDDNRPADAVRNRRTPWCSLTHAAQAAPPNSTIVIAPGRYDALKLSDRRVAGGVVTFQAADRRRRPQVAGADLNRVSGFRFANLLFVASVSLRNADNIQIDHNGFASSGIYLKAGYRVTIAANRIRALKGTNRAVLLQGATGPGARTNQDVSFRGNLIDDVDHDALAVYNGYRNLVVQNNRISNVHQPRNFKFHSDAMQFMGGDGLSLVGNTITDVTHGILFKDGVNSTNLRIQGNLVTGTPGAGLQVYRAPGAIIEHNTIWNTGVGFILGRGRASSLTANIFDRFQLFPGGAAAKAGRNVIVHGQPIGDPVYQRRPAFVDPRHGDFRLRSARPGAGIPHGRPVPGAQKRLG